MEISALCKREEIRRVKKEIKYYKKIKVMDASPTFPTLKGLYPQNRVYSPVCYMRSRSKTWKVISREGGIFQKKDKLSGYVLTVVLDGFDESRE